MYDVVVIGARCAGAPTAMLLAREGHKVLLVDRATFPSDIPHGHLIHREGPRCLHRWGLLGRIEASGCPPITTMTLDEGRFSLVGIDLVVDGVALGYGPRRRVFDALLVAAAVEAGVEMREGFVVDGVTSDGERITGVHGHDIRSGTPVQERAKVTVGADGRNSTLARAVQASVYGSVPVLTCWYFSYWSGVPARGLELYVREKRVIFAFPTNDGLFAVFLAWPAEELPAVRADIEGQFMATLDRAPELAVRVRGGTREERFYGATDLPNFFRRPYGPGWALVGDAGYHKDPYLALGMSDALRDAEALADALDAGLTGRSPLDEVLAGYERRRNEASMSDYRMNEQAARFMPPPPEQVQLFAALRGNQEDTNRLFLAREGMIPPETFFNPTHVGRIMATAAARTRQRPEG
ncbi:MAG TPA: FAD-dependent monooxygenase [Ktedonobacterales bacterium]|nr:FAD-dependent monooxygenase [Ktedonobacterales bacterium]